MPSVKAEGLRAVDPVGGDVDNSRSGQKHKK